MPDIDLGPVDGGSTRLRGYLATPSGAGPWPAVVVLHELFGLNDVVRRQADRLAAAGYVVIAPDLFSDGGAARCLISTFRGLFAQRGKPFADIEAARRYALERPDTTDKVGVVGFCMGGGFAIVASTRGFDAAAPNYGVAPRDLDAALSGACPVVASYGGRDLIAPGVAPKLEKALTKLGVPHDVKEYPDAGHSFMNDTGIGPAPAAAIQRIARIGPVPEAAADAWSRIEAFFAEHLAR
jgi:carboxymethylenebutenolidase